MGSQRHRDQGRDPAQAEDEPPVGAARTARRDLEDDHCDEIGDQDPHGDHPLLDDAQLAAPAARRELRDVGGGDRGVGADREPDERPGREQHGRVDRDRGQNRADGVDGGVADQQGDTG